jgi:hypothetical protein
MPLLPDLKGTITYPIGESGQKKSWRGFSFELRFILFLNHQQNAFNTQQGESMGHRGHR